MTHRRYKAIKYSLQKTQFCSFLRQKLKTIALAQIFLSRVRKVETQHENFKADGRSWPDCRNLNHNIYFLAKH